MSVTIIHKKGSGIPSADSLEVAEIAVDVVTGKLYTKTDDGKVVEISGSSGGGGSLWEQNGDDIYYNDGNVGVGMAPLPAGDNLQVAGNISASEVNATTLNGNVTDVPDHVKGISQDDIDTWNNPPSGGGGKTYGDGNGIAVNNIDDTIAMTGSYTGDFGVTGKVTATDDVVAFSDARLKENIKTLDGSKVFEMRGVSFDKDGKASSGVIAQELQRVAPELVHDDGEYLAVAYGNLVGYLIEAVKELKAEIEVLKRG